MAKIKLFLGEQLLEDLLDNDEIDIFFMKFNELHEALLQEKQLVPVELLFDLDSLYLYEDFDLYSLKNIIGNLVDGMKYCGICDAEYQQRNNYYRLDEHHEPPFRKVSCSATMDAFEQHVSGGSTIKLFSRDALTQSFVRVNSQNFGVSPALASIDAMTIDHSFIKIFLDAYVKPWFSTPDEYVGFRRRYLEFYKEFDWVKWIPADDPAPAHNVMAVLKACHTLSKEDAHLLKWGNLMAVLNGGKFNRLLTQLNESDKRINDIFQLGLNKGKSTIFYSIDTENGLLEMYDYRGVHCDKVYGLTKGIKEQKRNYSIDVPANKWLSK